MALVSGVITALITPFADGKVDEAGFARLIERQIGAGVAAIIPAGTTGESATVDLAEHEKIVALAVEVAAGRLPVIAGCGSNDTKTAIDHVKHAKKIGADAALVVAPYYNRPNQAGLKAHFLAIANAVELPIVVYNIPGRTSVDITAETLAELSAHPNIIGLKDSAGEPARTSLHRRLINKPFALYAGDDVLALGFGGFGTDGVVSVLSNVIPEQCVAMQKAILADDFATARKINLVVDELQRALFIEPNPGPAKYILSKLGLCAPDVRLPLAPLADSTKAILDDILTRSGNELGLRTGSALK